ncbi:pseudouridine synthase [Pelomyxa schiedti]|nr:pseudouridine synthase [Pelomyxa schiedti]
MRKRGGGRNSKHLDDQIRAAMFLNADDEEDIRPQPTWKARRGRRPAVAQPPSAATNKNLSGVKSKPTDAPNSRSSPDSRIPPTDAIHSPEAIQMKLFLLNKDLAKLNGRKSSPTSPQQLLETAQQRHSLQQEKRQMQRTLKQNGGKNTAAPQPVGNCTAHCAPTPLSQNRPQRGVREPEEIHAQTNLGATSRQPQHQSRGKVGRPVRNLPPQKVASETEEDSEAEEEEEVEDEETEEDEEVEDNETEEEEEEEEEESNEDEDEDEDEEASEESEDEEEKEAGEDDEDEEKAEDEDEDEEEEANSNEEGEEDNDQEDSEKTGVNPAVIKRQQELRMQKARAKAAKEPRWKHPAFMQLRDIVPQSVVGKKFHPIYHVSNGKRYVEPYWSISVWYTPSPQPAETLMTFLMKHGPQYASKLEEMAFCLKNGLVTVQGKTAVNPELIVKQNQQISCFYHMHEPPTTDQLPHIIGETKELLAIYKPASLIMHPIGAWHFNTFLGITNNVLGYPKATLLHRLDRVTSGVCIVAKDRDSSAITKHLRLIADHKFRKYYLARCKGHFLWHSLKVNKPLVMLSDSKGAVSLKGGKPAVTKFKRLKYCPHSDTTLLKCSLETGRTHQIRIHLSYLGFPIANDTTYGGTSNFLYEAHSKGDIEDIDDYFLEGTLQGKTAAKETVRRARTAFEEWQRKYPIQETSNETSGEPIPRPNAEATEPTSSGPVVAETLSTKAQPATNTSINTSETTPACATAVTPGNHPPAEKLSAANKSINPSETTPASSTPETRSPGNLPSQQQQQPNATPATAAAATTTTAAKTAGSPHTLPSGPENHNTREKNRTKKRRRFKKGIDGDPQGDSPNSSVHVARFNFLHADIDKPSVCCGHGLARPWEDGDDNNHTSQDQYIFLLAFKYELPGKWSFTTPTLPYWV